MLTTVCLLGMRMTVRCDDLDRVRLVSIVEIRVSFLETWAACNPAESETWVIHSGIHLFLIHQDSTVSADEQIAVLLLSLKITGVLVKWPLSVVFWEVVIWHFVAGLRYVFVLESTVVYRQEMVIFPVAQRRTLGLLRKVPEKEDRINQYTFYQLGLLKSYWCLWTFEWHCWPLCYYQKRFSCITHIQV